MHQTAIVREALSKGIETIEGIIHYGLNYYNVLVREHTITNVLRQIAIKDEIRLLKEENAKLRIQLQPKAKERVK